MATFGKNVLSFHCPIIVTLLYIFCLLSKSPTHTDFDFAKSSATNISCLCPFNRQQFCCLFPHVFHVALGCRRMEINIHLLFEDILASVFAPLLAGPVFLFLSNGSLIYIYIIIYYYYILFIAEANSLFVISLFMIQKC